MQIETRSSWGARFAAGRRPMVGTLPWAGVFAHHTGTSNRPATASLHEDRIRMQRIEEVGQQRFGYGVSYPFIVMPTGRIFEGTGITREGVHTAGYNATHSAICWDGNRDEADLTEPQKEATAGLLAHGYLNGWWGPGFFTGLHRDVRPTACPGRYGEAAVPEINRRAKAIVDAVVAGLPNQEATMLSAWATDAWSWVTGTRLMRGDSNPKAAVTREELAVVLHRALVEHPDDQVPGFARGAYGELDLLAKEAGIPWINHPAPNVPLTEARFVTLAQRLVRIVERIAGR